MYRITHLKTLAGRIKRTAIGAGAVVLFCAHGAAAATIGQFEEISTISSGAGTATLSSTGIGYTALGSSLLSDTIVSWVINTNLSRTPVSGSILGSLIPTAPGAPVGPLVQASLEDIAAEAGSITLLFGVNFDPRDIINDHLLVTLSNPEFTATTLDDLDLIIAPSTLTLAGTSIRVADAQMSVVPLPASLYLLGAGFAGLLASRRLGKTSRKCVT